MIPDEIKNLRWESWDGVPVSWAGVLDLAASATEFVQAKGSGGIAYSRSGDSIVIACARSEREGGGVELIWATVRRTAVLR